MKKMLIVMTIIFTLTVLTPLISLVDTEKNNNATTQDSNAQPTQATQQNDENELVTIFSGTNS